MATIIDGKAIAAQVRTEIAAEVARRVAAGRGVPGLATVICGARPDSMTYVRLKHQAALECGFNSIEVALPEEVTQEELLAKISELNANPACTGMIVQLPLPKHINERAALEAISPSKDADALHPLNFGLLTARGGNVVAPCTPNGAIELLRRYNIPIAGKTAVVIGRSNIVGLPAALLLMRANATVTIAHSQTPRDELVRALRNADIVVAGVGIPEFVRGEWLKPSCAVIDVGINFVPDTTKKSGQRMVGDVNFAEAKEVAAFITPVPGGCGPMTIAMLLQNTLRLQGE